MKYYHAICLFLLLIYFTLFAANLSKEVVIYVLCTGVITVVISLGIISVKVYRKRNTSTSSSSHGLNNTDLRQNIKSVERVLPDRLEEKYDVINESEMKESAVETPTNINLSDEPNINLSDESNINLSDESTDETKSNEEDYLNPYQPPASYVDHGYSVSNSNSDNHCQEITSLETIDSEINKKFEN